MSASRTNEAIRNIAIIAHVDHGKTTLVDQIFRQSGLFRDNQTVDERLMDNMDLERERGITIAAKNCSVIWDDIKINILDTPGHADFGGEVERALAMVDGAILLVDASEGPLPQTRFVLKKALELGLRIILVINKIDRPDSRIDEVLDEVYDLFIDLGANDEQIDFPVLYAIGRDGLATLHPDQQAQDLSPLMQTVLQEVPGPSYREDEPFQMLVTDLAYSDYLGRLAIGRVAHGSVRRNDSLICIDEQQQHHSLKVTGMQVYQGLTMQETQQVQPGDILILAGLSQVHIGDTICTAERPRSLPRIRVDRPTLSMHFSTNTSPFAGQEGKLVQSTRIRERLQRETLRSVALDVEEAPDADVFIVKGRGELQMAVLIETMRREGFELTVGKPQVIFQERDGQQYEPIEDLFIDCEEGHLGIISEKLAHRKGRMVNLTNHGSGRVRVQFSIPSRGLIGYRSQFLTDTRGTGIMNSIFHGYEAFRGTFSSRQSGSLVSDRLGEASGYALYNLEPRGQLFVTPGTRVYEGMIIGEHNRENDLDVNPCKEKKLSNVRASGKDDSIALTPVLPMTLEHAIEFIREDELVEVTPQNIRLRKTLLDCDARPKKAPRS